MRILSQFFAAPVLAFAGLLLLLAAPASAHDPEWSIAIHGGAGTMSPEGMDAETRAEYEAALQAALDAGSKVLAEGGTAMDAVVAAITLMEDDPKFNAGRGAVFTWDGTIEHDAALMDGRDTAPTGGVEYLAALGRTCDEVGVGRVATVCGRYHAMDRDRRWDRTRRAYEAMTRGVGQRGPDAGVLVEQAYTRGITDEFIEPCVVTDADGRPVGLLQDDDAVVFFNFRADRARQLTRALAFDDFDGFDRTAPPSLQVLTFTEDDATFGLPVAFPPQTFSGSLADVLTANDRTNLRLAETEKYAHVTYFFNCGEEQPARGEDRILVPSPTVPTYDLQPEMSAAGITDHLVADLDAGRHDVIICNFANADMVGHTGRLDAAVTAVETLDGGLARIVAAVKAAGGTLIITADHGNAEQMWDTERNGPHTAHTTNPVPVLLIGPDVKAGMPLSDGSLRDVAPTMLGVLGIAPPPEMTGRDLRRWLE